MKQTNILVNRIAGRKRPLVIGTTATLALAFAIVQGARYAFDFPRPPAPSSYCRAWIESTAERGDSALIRTTRLAKCLDEEMGAVERLAFWPTKRMVAALWSTPCRFVATWTTSREKSPDYVVVLKSKHQFTARPAGSNVGEDITGSWGVHRGRMIWMYDRGPIWPPETNRMIDVSQEGFTLVEADGSRTRYTNAGPTDLKSYFEGCQD
jgi:hypothetical protein